MPDIYNLCKEKIFQYCCSKFCSYSMSLDKIGIVGKFGNLKSLLVKTPRCQRKLFFP